MYFERKIAKDSWRLNLPAEQMIDLGISKGDNLALLSDKSRNIIILTPAENASEVNLELKDFSTDEVVDLIIDFVKRNPKILNKLADKISLDNSTQEELNSSVERCYNCGKELYANTPYLKLNGHKICSECKKLEVQKFLLYLERRKLNAKEG